MDPYNVPVSIKGIIFEEGKVWLRYNQRNEWELPGGKMDQGEQPDETCKREILEELGFVVKVGPIVQSHLYTIKISPAESKEVFVVSYLCDLLEKKGNLEEEWEEGRAKFNAFGLKEVEKLNMPEFYREAIRTAWSFER